MLNIVLVEPEIPQNTGNIARTCACIGARLHVVEPAGFRITERNLRRAGCDYWNDVEIVRWACAEEFFEAHAADELHLFTGHVNTTFGEVAYPTIAIWCSVVRAVGSTNAGWSVSRRPVCAFPCAMACAA